MHNHDLRFAAVLFGFVFLINLLSTCSTQPGIDEIAKEGEPLRNKTVEVTVYYEALCYDTMVFFTQKLVRSHRVRHDKMKLQLVPYGKAIHNLNQTTGRWEIDCHHGQRECELNIMHACILDIVEFNLAFPMIACLLRGIRTTVEECARIYSIDLNPIRTCAKSTKGLELFIGYGNQTKTIDLSFVPSIAIDQKFNYDDQSNLLSNFDETFCQKYYEKFQEYC